jgi:hypothetical protein
MVGHKTELIRFVLDSSQEEEENLAIFFAGMQAEKGVCRCKKGCLQDPRYTLPAGTEGWGLGPAVSK